MPPDKKPESKPPQDDPFVEVISVLFVIFIVIYIINGFVSAISHNRILSQGWKGFTVQSVILSHTRPIDSLAHPVGSQVISTKETAVYSSPGGEQTGTQKFNSKGKILQGPVIIGGVRYWYVDYESGSDGWVRESDIAYVESKPDMFEQVLIFVFSTIDFLKMLAIVLSVIFILCVIYIFRKLVKLRTVERALLYPEIDVREQKEENPKWRRVLDHIESQNENDWRLAIIEADIMLDDLLDKLSLPGETVGDKLKAVEKSDFTTIDNAWEAHKTRNQVAHEGSDVPLSQREARRIIELYRTVFEEFQII